MEVTNRNARRDWGQPLEKGKECREGGTAGTTLSVHQDVSFSSWTNGKIESLTPFAFKWDHVTDF